MRLDIVTFVRGGGTDCNTFGHWTLEVQIVIPFDTGGGTDCNTFGHCGGTDSNTFGHCGLWRYRL